MAGTIARRLVPLLPRNAVLSLSRWLGGFIFRRNSRLRRRAMANLEAAFGPALSAGRKAAIARESFDTMVLTGLDLFWFAGGTSARIKRYVRFHPSFAELILGSGPLVAVTGHIGNWELLGLAAAAYGRAIWSVATPLSASAVDGLLNKLRSVYGMRVVRPRGAARAVETILRRGGTVAVLVDQNTLPAQGGVFVDFFGLPAPMSRLPAVLAARTGAPLVPVCCLGDGAGFYTAYAMPAIDLSARRTDAAAGTQAVADALQRMIAQTPAQWLWAYSRWRYIPDGAQPERYPFYASRLHEAASRRV